MKAAVSHRVATETTRLDASSAGTNSAGPSNAAAVRGPVTHGVVRWRICWRAIRLLLSLRSAIAGDRFEAIHRRVRETPVGARSGASEREVLLALNYAIAIMPSSSRCLHRSAAAVLLLREHGFAAQLVLGARTKPFGLHAWVELDGHPVNERWDTTLLYTVTDRC